MFNCICIGWEKLNLLSSGSVWISFYGSNWLLSISLIWDSWLFNFWKYLLECLVILRMESKVFSLKVIILFFLIRNNCFGWFFLDKIYRKWSMCKENLCIYEYIFYFRGYWKRINMFNLINEKFREY